jgi:hypothetical protein
LHRANLEFVKLKEVVVQETNNILVALIEAVEDCYPDSYLNSLFKNKSKCSKLSETISSSIAEEIG